MNYVKCTNCGRHFETPSNLAQYCTPSCRVTASRRRTAARRDAAEGLLGRIVDAMNRSTEDIAPLITEARALLSGGHWGGAR